MSARRPRRLLAFEVEPGSTACALLEPEAGGLRVVHHARAPRNGDLGASFVAAREAIGARTPRDAIVLHPGVVAGSVRLPGEGLAAERLAGLVRWELDPYLESDGEDADVAVGWASPGSGDLLLACAARESTRGEVLEAAKRAGLKLHGIYPTSGAAAGAAADADLLVDVGSGRMGIWRFAEGAVLDYRVEPLPADLVTACLDLQQPGAACRLLGELAAGDQAELEALGWSRLGPAEVSAGLAGGAHHALGIAGGERVPCLVPHAPKAAWWLSEAFQAGLLIALVLAALLGLELQYSAWIADARLAVSETRAGLNTKAQPLPPPAEFPLGARQRAAGYMAALGELAPEGVVLERFTYDPQRGLEVTGFALDPEPVHQYQEQLSVRWKSLGHRAAAPVIKAETGRLGVTGFGFQLSFTRQGAR